eukprot:CAMPEP_0172605472 /NCGR_PEP_ID=MMETSP1068-20121228/25713_1 /TAXON_ID=35684 /ORGANISM="Pseudopedinella elastica, Strain CCMP716" /LENGTH=151 /DNA_ID=CAMNT_0013407895 /DNA_START=74 /DNA_END=526 /DNA_ORIENTATION=+
MPVCLWCFPRPLFGDHPPAGAPAMDPADAGARYDDLGGGSRGGSFDAGSMTGASSSHNNLLDGPAGLERGGSSDWLLGSDSRVSPLEQEASLDHGYEPGSSAGYLNQQGGGGLWMDDGSMEAREMDGSDSDEVSVTAPPSVLAIAALPQVT